MQTSSQTLCERAAAAQGHCHGRLMPADELACATPLRNEPSKLRLERGSDVTGINPGSERLIDNEPINMKPDAHAAFLAGSIMRKSASFSGRLNFLNSPRAASRRIAVVTCSFRAAARKAPFSATA